MQHPFPPAGQLVAAALMTAALVTANAWTPSAAQAVDETCTKTSEEIYLHDLSDGLAKVKAGDKLEYRFVVQNNAAYNCTETVAFHYSSRYLSIKSISTSGKVLKGKGQVAWENQVIEPINTDVDYYYRVVATVKKKAPKSRYTTYATATRSGTGIPGMTSASKCTELGDQCDRDQNKVTK